MGGHVPPADGLPNWSTCPPSLFKSKGLNNFRFVAPVLYLPYVNLLFLQIINSSVVKLPISNSSVYRFVSVLVLLNWYLYIPETVYVYLSYMRIFLSINSYVDKL